MVLLEENLQLAGAVPAGQAGCSRAAEGPGEPQRTAQSVLQCRVVLIHD